MKLRSILTNTLSLLLVFMTMGNVYGQNPAQCDSITGLPMDMVVSNDPDSCNAVVNWAEPTYSATYCDFTGALTAVNWTYFGNGLGDTIILNNPPFVDSITLIGAVGPTQPPVVTDYCVQVPFDANISFDWTASMQGGFFLNDEPAVVVGAVEFELQSNSAANFEMGRDTFFVPKDTTFCFRVNSETINFNTTLQIDSLKFEITGINQVKGDTSGAIFQVGVIDTIGYEIIDADLNTYVCEFTVTVEDDEDPVITTPGNVMASQMLACVEDVSPNALEARFNEGIPAISDNCNGTVSEAELILHPDVADGWTEGEMITINGMTVYFMDQIIPHPGGICTAPNQRKYRILRSWFLEDGAGNEDMLQQNINVVDNFIEPTIAAKGMLPAFELDANCSVLVTADSLLDRENTFDNCGIYDVLDPSTYDVDTTAVIRITGSGNQFTKSILLDKGDIDFSNGCPASLDIDMYVVDSCGNYSDTIIVSINVSDVLDPIITAMPPDTMFQGCDESVIYPGHLSYSEVDSTIDFTTFIATGGDAIDGCGSIMSVTYKDSLDMGIMCDGSNPIVRVIRTYTVTDSCGNTATDTQNISITESTPPTFNCPASITVNTSDDGEGTCSTTAAGIELQNVADNCANISDLVISYSVTGATMINGKDDASNTVAFNGGLNNVEYFVRDCAGNMDSCSFNVLVLDDEDPEIDCSMSPVVMANDDGVCNAVVCYDVEADDNCVDPAPTSMQGMQFLYKDNITGHTYFTVSLFQAQLWEDANRIAEERGGYLVSINSQEEQDSIEKYTGEGRFWIGLRYSPSLDAFKWTSGEPVNYTNWAPGRPGGFLSGDYVFNLEIFGSEVGWVDAQSILPARYIVEFEPGPRVELLSGLPSGSIFPIGATQVEYRAVDAAGNADTCMITVIVEDREAPVITCNPDITIDLMPSQCDTLLNFPDPTAKDNCSAPEDITINQIDATGLSSGSLFPIGLTELIYEAVDTSDNRDTCSMFIQVNEYQVQELACEDYNLSLDELTCSGEVTVEALTDGSEIGCPDSCEITITDLLGVPHPNAFGPADINKTFEYTIHCGGNSCWAQVTIEDKVKPYIMVCEDDTISCTEDMSVAKEPIAFDNCGADVVLLQAPYTKLDCDSLFVGKYTRKYIAIDIAGNQSEDTCTQVVYVRRTDFTGIIPPRHRMDGAAMNCKEFTPLANGAPSPADSGVPTLNGKDLYPFDPADICNGFGKFEDVITFQTDCKTFITRTWTFGEWHCDSIKRVSFPQFIQVVDKKGPELTVPDDYTVNVDGKNCEATVVLDPVVYEDNCSAIKDIFVTTGSGDIINDNGGVASLPVGTNTIVYTVTDMCGNVSKDSMEIEVIEEQEPIAVCETYTTVSLDGTGLVWLSAESIDDGSFDECDDYVKLEISRMNDPCGMNGTEWADQVAFCCADADALSNPMVFLRVSDKKGNSNSCMVEVEVQDKNKPRITCPDDMQVTCDFTFDPNLLDLSFDPVIVGGTPCLGSVKISDGIITNTLDQCRIGYLIRNIEVEFKGENIGVCTQRIDFVQDNPISEGLIDWPDDITITDMCSMLDLEPANLPDNADTPDVPDGGCNLVGVTKEDKTYPFAGNGACFKVLRTWSVIDWCARNGSSADTIPEYTWVQTIYVQNLDAPEITSSVDTVYKESLSADCTTVPVELLASATDICTPVDELQWDYVVTLEDGTEITGKGNDASGSYPEGTHRVDFTVMDRCGNVSATGYVFVVITKTKPVMVCYNSISTALVAMDTSGNGDTVALSMLTPEMLDNDTYHTCFDDDELIFSFDTLPGADLLTLDCNNLLSDTMVNMYAIDPNGSYNYCKVTISVIDSFGLCNLRVGLGGRVVTQDNRHIMDTEVHLMSEEDEVDMTDIEGTYIFPDMPVGGEYTVQPFKDGDDMNGVSTLDLIMIQRHILGIEDLNNPYALIAADINSDQKISTTDLVALRKLILGVYQEFPENTSWRFVDAGYNFPDPEDPWVEGFDEDYFIDKLVSDMQIDFVGTKIGDVNNSASVNVRSGDLESRSNTPIVLSVENKNVKAGDIIDVTFEILDETTISGLQLGLAFDGLNILDVKGEALNVSELVSYIVNDGIRICYDHNNNREVIPSTASLFTITIQARFDGLLSDMISINDERFKSEIYDHELNISDVSLRWNEDVQYQQFDVAQNQPNPWQNATTIDVNLPQDGKINFSIFDISGKVLYQNTMNLKSGINKINLTKEMLLSSGVMFYEVEYQNQVVRKKMFNVR